MNRELVDLSFGIQHQAMMILYALKIYALELPRDCFPTTSPFYNGRETGIVLTLQTTVPDETIPVLGRKTIQLNICFGECRNSDSIVVDVWQTQLTFNPPTVVNLSEEAYRNRKYFGNMEIKQAAQYIIEQVKEFLSN